MREQHSLAMAGSTAVAASWGGHHVAGRGSFQLGELPDCLSPEARSLITVLLIPEPSRRLGCGAGGGAAVAGHAFFAPLDWGALLRRRHAEHDTRSSELAWDFCSPFVSPLYRQGSLT